MDVKKLMGLTTEQTEQVHQLWNAEFPSGLAHRDISAFQAFLAPLGNKTHYLLLDKTVILGWALTFDRDSERWFSILVNNKQHKKGLGKHLIETIKADNRSLNGWAVDHGNDIKSDGSPYSSPIGFYQKLGFDILSDVRLEKPGLSCVKIRWNSHHSLFGIQTHIIE
ncbi:acetyltransferase (GNAT) family protein [Roseivirga pacifica]|uniref:Acetyltransferase (GNAT) domain-containing protein n=1 Tax=Roseivirga pacifica TaxID=1267423 RepID=A0A1I0QXL4_9BACT|nr:GNAT family N-acetyltransferase [Roseivirga pacifica]RKQ42417.1 acetyltransferase (GNAT) family protein [Roseivirga pacifica]SEW32294.1 Acetyltransferase (GNAT) domain-containing protein [Roseivirga pacifica]